MEKAVSFVTHTNTGSFYLIIYSFMYGHRKDLYQAPMQHPRKREMGEQNKHTLKTKFNPRQLPHTGKVVPVHPLRHMGA